MRILYSHRIQSRDGQSVHLEEMVSAFRAHGHEVLVVGPGFYETAGFGDESRIVTNIRQILPSALAELAELLYNIPAWWRLRKAIKAFKPELIYERYNLFFVAGWYCAKRHGMPYFLEVNSPLAEERERHGGLKLRRLARAAEAFVWRRADCVLAVSHVLADRIEAAGLSRARIVVTPNGVKPSRFPKRKCHGSRSPILGFVGFVRPWHGLDSVIRGMARSALPMQLVVAGDGPVRDELERAAASLGVAGRVRFTGVVPRDDIPQLLSQFDIALQPQAVDYASPLKLVEYMAAGCAIVAPNQKNIRELVEHRRTALLFDPNDEGAMWAAIEELAGNAVLRAKLGAAAAAEVMVRNLTWAGNVERVCGAVTDR
jgi:glycosyltransferase involved in cell wall biosynthesis